MINFAQYARYSRPGPRYTSYPTAIEFSENITYETYISHIHASNDKQKPLSLYLHIPFCRSACYFCGCNVVFTSKEEKKERYIGYLEKEIALLKTVLDTSREVVQIHFGGGTPTFMDADQLQRIIALLRGTFPNIACDAEISCEIDPRHLNEKQMEVLAKGGFNRVSFGVQDFDCTVQEAVHRVQSVELTKATVELARRYGMTSVNIDLIYGLPYQSLESFNKTLELAVSLDPDRFAIFNYAHVPWLKKTMRKIDETTLPEPAEKLRILESIMNYLTAKGYATIGMDHFAKPEDELFRAIEKGELHRNFQGYTTKGGSDLIGIGLTSISEFDRAYTQNFKEMTEYEMAIDSGKLPYNRAIILSDDDKIRQMVIMELMSNFKISKRAVEEKFGIKFADYFADSLAELVEFKNEGLVIESDDTLEIIGTGQLLVRNIVLPFDAYMKKIGSGTKVFSKTV